MYINNICTHIYLNNLYIFLYNQICIKANDIIYLNVKENDFILCIQLYFLDVLKNV